MRILHTADWHLGKTLEGRSRFAEQEAFVEEICELCDQEKVDLVLIAGDVFQHTSPGPAAEGLFYYAIERLSRYGTRGVVVIAGNHDHPDRLCASTPLAQRLGINLVGYPQEPLPAALAGNPSRVSTVAAGPSWLELVLPGCGQRAVIGALPYPSEGRLKAMLAPGLDLIEQQAGYSERVGRILAGLAAHFRPDTVNLLVSHLYVRGGLASTAEADNRQLGAAYAVDPAVFPARTQYVALGHLHRPQVVRGAVVPVRYAGSPLVYSFAEAGQAKSVVLVEGEPGKPLAAREVYLSAGRPLVTWEATGGIDEVCRWLAAGKDNQAWIDLCLHVTEALTPVELAMLKSRYDRFVHIRPVFPGQEEQVKAWEELRSLPLEEQFGRFYRHRTGGAEPGTELVRLFMELVQAVDRDETVALPEKGG